MKSYLKKKHTLFVDNFYTSFELIEFMYEKGTIVLGTVLEDHERIPAPITQIKLKRGDSVYAQKNNFLILKWKDKRNVIMMSSRYNANFKEVKNRFGKSKLKPEVIADYNDNMSGIDRSDQIISYYSTSRKTIRWYQ